MHEVTRKPEIHYGLYAVGLVEDAMSRTDPEHERVIRAALGDRVVRSEDGWPLGRLVENGAIPFEGPEIRAALRTVGKAADRRPALAVVGIMWAEPDTLDRVAGAELHVGESGELTLVDGPVKRSRSFAETVNKARKRVTG